MRSPHRLGDRRWGHSAEPISCYSLATTHSIARRTPVRQQRPVIQRDARDGRAHTLFMAYTDHEAVVHYHGWTIPGPSPAGQRPDRGGPIGWWRGGPGLRPGDQPFVAGEVSQRRRLFSYLLVQPRHVVMGVREPWLQHQRGAVGLDRVGRPVQVLECDPKVERRGRVVGTLVQREPVMALGLLDEPLLVQQSAQVEVGIRMWSVELRGTPVGVPCLPGVHGPDA